MHRFHVADSLALVSNYVLPIEVVRHINVLRLRISDPVCLFNGDGYDYHANIKTLSRHACQVEILNRFNPATESKLDITLLMSLIANDKFELILQKAVELGVTRIIPILSEKTQHIKKERKEHKLLHWQKIIIAATEQCGRAKFATLGEIMPLEAALQMHASELNLILSPHHHGNESRNEIDTFKLRAITLAIGPEGGFTLAEIELANNLKYANLNLGPRILRAETAAIAGISFVHSNYGDFMNV